MTRYVLAVHTNPVEGREDEYNDWYSNRHLADLLAIPGVVSARRYVLGERQMTAVPQAFKYLALYEIETADGQDFIDQVFARSGTEHMPISAALGSEKTAVLWRAIS